MKKLLLIPGFLCAFVCSTNRVDAQLSEGQIVLTTGVGQSFTSLLFTVLKDGLNTTDGSSSTIPNLVLNADYGIKESFSLGVAYSYQSLSYTYKQYTQDSVTYSGNFEDNFIRQNIGGRALFHFGNGEDLDLYAGARGSYTFWNHTTNRMSGGTVDFGNTFSNRMRFQVLFGMRYFFNPNIGVNLEVAIGPPYFLMGGLNFAFGGK